MVAIDCNGLRRSCNAGKEHFSIHFVSVWVQTRLLVLAHEAEEGRSKETAAILPLLQMLELANSIVTLEAMRYQKGVAPTIYV